MVNAKSLGLAPPSTTEEMCSVAPPELVTVTAWGELAVPCVTAPNPSAVAERETSGFVGGAAVAVPLTWMDCGEFWASSVTVTVAERWPAASGVNVSVMVQLEFAA